MNETPAVRADDVARCRVTLVREDGTQWIMDPAEHPLPRLDGFPPPGELYNPRLFIEELLRLGFDDRWVSIVTYHMHSFGLFMRADSKDA